MGLSAGLFQLLSHAIFKAALFLMAGVLIHTTGSKYINDMGGLKDKLKLTFAVFLIAAASLSGIPPLGGFWSKDAVPSAAWNSGQIGLFLVGSVTAGDHGVLRLPDGGIVFFGQRSANIGGSEGEARALCTTRGPLACVPYAILGARDRGSRAAGLLRPGGRAPARSPAPTSTSLFGAAAAASPAGDALARESFDYTAPITLAFVVVGLLLRASSTIRRRSSPPTGGRGSGFAQTIHTFLVNRWYINAIYYKVFVDAPLSITEWTAIHFERTYSSV